MYLDSNTSYKGKMPRKKKAKRAARGTESFKTTKTGLVQYRITYKDEYDKPQRKTFSGLDEQECLEKYEMFLKDLERMRAGIDVYATIPEIVKKQYQNDFKLNYVGEQGYSRNIATLTIIEKSGIGSLPIVDVTKNHIQLFLSSVTGYSNSVISKLYQQLKIAFAIACDKEIITKNIMLSRDIKCPKSDKPDKKISGYTMEEQKKLVEAINAHKIPCGRNSYKHQVLIELYTGMRMGEINALRLEDIDLKNSLVYVRRTVSRGIEYRPFIKDGTKIYAGLRDIPINNNARKVFEAALSDAKRNPEGLVFYDYYKHGIVETSQVNCFFKRICEKASIPFNGQHALRHTFATRCIESGIQPVVLKKWMGHKNIHVTLDTYADVFDKMNNDAVANLDAYLSEM